MGECKEQCIWEGLVAEKEGENKKYVMVLGMKRSIKIFSLALTQAVIIHL